MTDVDEHIARYRRPPHEGQYKLGQCGASGN